MKQYSSFEEIDRDLKILKLQTQIDKEEIKLTFEQTKDSLSPVSMIGSIFGSVLQKALVLKAVAKIFGVKRVVTSSKH
ncbi:DUF6327 family protein [Salegentibacter chungangensis]|uniref:DUF6327 family protein n=1 Tax=Salegentibacter chungangensis TaxID=1335724 RepID=A0ABW3NNW0_9FLAO